jgi:VanZ family protein
MSKSLPTRNLVLLTAIMVAAIVYGCLYPFKFDRPLDISAAVNMLMASRAEWHGRGDFILNVLLYLPFGFSFSLALDGAIGGWKRIGLVIFAAALLSTSIELTQYCDKGRTTAAINIYCNILGAALGVTLSSIVTGLSCWKFLETYSDRRVPALLLAVWLTYRLFPYVPLIHGHEYSTRIQKLFNDPHLTLSSLSSDLGSWLVIGLFAKATCGGKTAHRLFSLLVGLALSGRIFIAGPTLTTSELAGVCLAVTWLILVRNLRLTAALAAFALILPIAGGEFAAHPFTAHARPFGWIPFEGLMKGSEHDVTSFLQRVFLYGSLIWLMTRLRIKLLGATALTATGALAMSWIQRYLPDAPAEITDTTLSTLMGIILGLLDSRNETTSQPTREIEIKQSIIQSSAATRNLTTQSDIV